MIKLERPLCPNKKALENWDYKNIKNKEALEKSTNKKCMYCESNISHTSYAHIEHIKPKAIWKFPELEFNWDNLWYACPLCNINKSDKYDENFINPYIDDPELFLKSNWWIFFSKKWNNRWELTIDFLKLNRADLLQKRYEKIEEIRPLITRYHQCKIEDQKEAILEQINQEANSDKEYSFCVKKLIKDEII